MGSDRLYREVICRLTMSEGRQSQIVLLDDRRLDILVKPKLYAGELLDMVASHFSLKEKEYFGLAYADDTGHYSWLQLDRRVLEHEFPKRSTSATLVLYFRIKYFVESITHLKDSSTVEAFYLQTQSLVYNGILEVGSDKAFQLAALVLQATHGDYSSDTLAKQQLKKLSVLPTSTLADHPSLTVCEDRVLEQYITLQGLSRGASIVNYMRIAESLPTYGFHYYEVKDKGGIPWWLGISYRGICQYDLTDRKVPRKLFLWKQLENLYFRDRKFSIEVYDPKRVSVASRKTGGGFGVGSQLSVHVWFSSSPALTKCIWSMAIAQHQFYLDRKHAKSGGPSFSRNLTDIADELSHGSYSTETSSLGRSVSSLSLPTLKMDSDSCDETPDTVEMFTALKARKEALEKALRKRYDELKKICVREGELTGALPPEMPLSPGEQIPVVRRKIGVPVKDRMLWRKKTKDEEELSHLELQHEIQTKIVGASLKLLNDGLLKKNLRRQRKLSHQKAMQKLKEIEQRLIHLRKKEYSSKDEAYHSNNDALLQQSANLKDLSITFSPTEPEKDVKNSLNKMTSSKSSPLLLPSHVRPSTSVPSSPSPRRIRNAPSNNPPPDLQGYTPSAVYQTRTTYRSQQYPTFSMKSPTDSASEEQPLYRNKYESTLDLDGSNIYSVPTQRTSQAFDTQDDMLAPGPAPSSQDLGLVSRHNSLDRNRRRDSQKHRSRPGSAMSQDIPSFAHQQAPPATRVMAYPFHHPHQYHHHRMVVPVDATMYQRNLKLYAPEEMYLGGGATLKKDDARYQDRGPTSDTVYIEGGSTKGTDKLRHLVSPEAAMLKPSDMSAFQRQLDARYLKRDQSSKPDDASRHLMTPNPSVQRHSPTTLQCRTSASIDSFQARSSVVNDPASFQKWSSGSSPTPTDSKKWIEFGVPPGALVSPSGGVPTSVSVDSFKPRVDVVEYGEFKPYWEETKPYETSDFYKYSTKHRKQQHQVASQSLQAKILAWKANQSGGAMSPVLERSRTASPACPVQQDAGTQSKRERSDPGHPATDPDSIKGDTSEWCGKQGKKITLV